MGALVNSRPEWAGTATAESLPNPAGDYVPAIDLAVPAGYGRVWTTAPNPVPVIPAVTPATTDEGPDWGPPVSRDMLEPSDRQTDNPRRPLAHRTRHIPDGSRRYTHILGTDGAVQDIWCAYQPKRVVWKPQILVLLSHNESDPPAQGLSCVIAYPDNPGKPEYWETASRREGIATEVERIMDSLPLAQCLSYRLSLPSKGKMDYLPRSFNTPTKRARAGQFEHDGYTYNLCFRRAKHNPMNVQVGATYASIDEVDTLDSATEYTAAYHRFGDPVGP